MIFGSQECTMPSVIAKIFVYERAVIYCAVDGQKQSVMFFLFLEIQHVAQ